MTSWWSCEAEPNQISSCLICVELKSFYSSSVTDVVDATIILAVVVIQCYQLSLGCLPQSTCKQAMAYFTTLEDVYICRRAEHRRAWNAKLQSHFTRHRVTNANEFSRVPQKFSHPASLEHYHQHLTVVSGLAWEFEDRRCQRLRSIQLEYCSRQSRRAVIVVFLLGACSQTPRLSVLRSRLLHSYSWGRGWGQYFWSRHRHQSEDLTC